MRVFGVIIVAASLCASGCGLMGGSATPEREQEKQTLPTESAAPASPAGDTPDLAAARALWKGAQCSDPHKADSQLTAVLGDPAQAGVAAEALALRGLARSQLGMKEEAFEDLTAAVRQHPVARNYAWRALALWRAGNTRGAHTDAQYALRKDKTQPVAHMVLGMAALKEGGAAGCTELRTACEGGECSGLEEAQKAGQCPR